MMPWCMNCKKIYPAGTEICPDCGDLLEDGKPAEGCSGDCSTCGICTDEESCTGNCDQGIWPTDDDGEPVTPALLTTVTGTQLDYQLLLAQLRSYGIPVLGTFTATGNLAKLILGFAGTGMDVYVPETMVELARELLEPAELPEEEEAPED